jgi:hypothetical protein
MADPKNYPDLEADFQQIDDLGDAYRINNFLTYPDKVAKLATDFPQMTKWCSERFAKYKNLIVISGGKDSPLYKRYEKTAKAIQGFQKAAGDFVKSAESAVPTKLAEAEKMGDEAAKNKKPAFFTGGVKQKLDEAQGMMKVCRAFLKADDKRMIALETAYAKTKKATDAQAASLKELITAEMRAPADNYSGDDKKAIEKEILDAWKEKWPKDKVLGLRFHMKQFDRRVEWTYYEASSTWKKSDVSVLCITVIVQTSDTIATMYPSYVNLDNISSKRTLGVDTKGGIYVNEEMLVKNL